MDTPQKRLEAAASCGVVRDGHPMTMVRLDDVQTLTAAVVVMERTAQHVQQQRDEAWQKIETLEAELAAVKGRLEAARVALC